MTSRRPAATVTQLVPAQAGPPRGTAYSVQGALALDLRRRPTEPESRAPGAEAPGAAPAPLPAPSLREEHELRAWAARFAQAVVETVGLQRPVSQLLRWTSPEVFRDLERRTQLLRRTADPAHRSVRPQVRSVHVCRPGPAVAEVSVHVRHGHRSRALALRLEVDRRDGRWLCTVLEFG